MGTVTFDKASGIVRAEIGEFMGADQARSFMRELDAACTEARLRVGHAKIFIDASYAPVQSAEVMEHFINFEALTKGERDRLAVVVSSSLATMQAKRALLTDSERTFASTSEALEWLSAI